MLIWCSVATPPSAVVGHAEGNSNDNFVFPSFAQKITWRSHGEQVVQRQKESQQLLAEKAKRRELRRNVEASEAAAKTAAQRAATARAAAESYKSQVMLRTWMIGLFDRWSFQVYAKYRTADRATASPAASPQTQYSSAHPIAQHLHLRSTYHMNNQFMLCVLCR